jgi:hypothetical protein
VGPVAHGTALGTGTSLEPIRFAGANRPSVDLGYYGTVRRIEPYSLRVSRAGDLLLYALRADGSGIRAYASTRSRPSR